MPPDLRDKSPSQVKVMTLTLTWLSDFFLYFFDFFFVILIQKKGPNCPKVCQKCKILTKWPFGTKRKRQNVFSRSPSKKFKVIFLTFFKFPKKSKSLLWLLDDLNWLFLKKMTFGASLLATHCGHLGEGLRQVSKESEIRKSFRS